MTPEEIKKIFDEFGDEPLFKRLREGLDDEQLAFAVMVIRQEGYCSRCGGNGDYCCYDSVLE